MLRSLLLVSLILISSGRTLAGTTPANDLYTLSFKHLDGSNASFETYRGKVLLVNFWASWCPPCVHEMPALNNLAQHFQGQPFAVVAINAGESADAVQRFSDKLNTPLELQLLLDTEGRTFSVFKVPGLPMSYLFNRQGELIKEVSGIQAWDGPEWQKRIRALIAP